ncbi:MAG: hypothetical protein WBK95_07675, partial [Sulfurimonas sp.]
DGRLGIFDTKPLNDREEDKKVKNEALQKYIKEENKNGKNLFGGLIVKDKSEHFKINQKEDYKSFKDSLDDWEYFNI